MQHYAAHQYYAVLCGTMQHYAAQQYYAAHLYYAAQQ